MLQHLSIRHYALIEQLDIDFGDGLNMLTGETGSGKSIVLGAMGLLLGERADMRTVQEGKNKCVVEGTFAVSGLNLEGLFAHHDLDFEPHTTIRREILNTGKSRAFVNDTPVNLKVLRELGMKLVDIHSQHQTLQINDPAYQLRVLDRYADTEPLLTAYRAVYRQYRQAAKALDVAIDEDRQARVNIEFMKFQLKELEAIDLDGTDQTELDEELNLLANADQISGELTKAVTLLSEGEPNVRTSLREAHNALNALGTLARHYDELAVRLRSAEIEVSDVAREVELLLGKVEVDPNRLEKLEALQSQLFRLEQKHGVQGVEALVQLRNELRLRIAGVDDFELRLEELRGQLDEALKVVKAAGLKLRNARDKASEGLSTGIVQLLRDLNMPHARLEVLLEPLDVPGPDGTDKAQFYFSANAGHKPAPLGEVASGGELSRLMLAIKCISATPGLRTTIVFDEIDTGVSGEVAHSMGRIMQKMSSGLQVLCITHLPQIAAKGDRHYKVFKELRAGRTITDITELQPDERVQEIAQMLSGAKASEAALANARELLGAEA